MLLKGFYLLSAISVCWVFVLPEVHAFPFFINFYDDEVVTHEEAPVPERDVFYEKSTSEAEVKTLNTQVGSEKYGQEGTIVADSETDRLISELHQHADQTKVVPEASLNILQDNSNRTMEIFSSPDNSTDKVEKLDTSKQSYDKDFDGRNTGSVKDSTEDLQILTNKTPNKDLMSADTIEDGVHFTGMCFKLVAALIDGLLETLITIGQPILNSRPNQIQSEILENPSKKLMKRDVSVPNLSLEGKTDKQKHSNQDRSEVFVEEGSTLETELAKLHQAKHEITPSEKAIVASDLITNDQKTSQYLTLNNNKTDIRNKTGLDYYTINVINNNEGEPSISKDTNPSPSSDLVTRTNNEIKVLDEIKKTDLINVITEIPILPSQSPQDEKVKPEVIEIMPKNTNKKVLTEDISDERSSTPNLYFANFNKELKQQEVFSQKKPLDSLSYQNEYESPNDESISNGTILLIVGTIAAVTLVLAVAGLATIYKFQLINFSRTRRGNQNPSGPRSSLA